MVYFKVPPDTAEIGAEVELFREILHAVIKVRSQHHLEFLGVDLSVLVHHEIRRAGRLEIEAVVRSVRIAQAEEMRHGGQNSGGSKQCQDVFSTS